MGRGQVSDTSCQKRAVMSSGEWNGAPGEGAGRCMGDAALPAGAANIQGPGTESASRGLRNQPDGVALMARKAMMRGRWSNSCSVWMGWQAGGCTAWREAVQAEAGDPGGNRAVRRPPACTCCVMLCLPPQHATPVPQTSPNSAPTPAPSTQQPSSSAPRSSAPHRPG